MELLPGDLVHRLQANGRASAADPFGCMAAVPVVRLYRADRGGEWFLSEIRPDDADRAYGLMGRGRGVFHYGAVSLSALRHLRDTYGLPVQRDAYFRPGASLAMLCDGRS